MSFKDDLLDDLNKVFFNSDEFAEGCTWNQYRIKAIIDDESLIRKYSAEFQNLNQGSHVIYVTENQFSSIPQLNDAVVFNNNLYSVNELKREDGMLTIFLELGRA